MNLGVSGERAFLSRNNNNISPYAQLPELLDLRLWQRLTHNVGHAFRHHRHVAAAMQAHQAAELGGRRVRVAIDPNSDAVENRSKRYRTGDV